MKIAFFSNYLSHFQMSMCQAFLDSKDVEFVFVATREIEKSRLDMGFEDMNERPFVVRTYDGETSNQEALSIARDFDIAIFGDAPSVYLEERMKGNKLSFKYCERLFKKGTWRRFIPKIRKRINKGYIQYRNKNLYILGASAYTSSDLSLCGFNKDKCFRWGYFPEIKECDANVLLKNKNLNDKIEILYAGRLLKLKRVIDTVKALSLLLKKGINNFHFTIIGDGEERQNICDYIGKNDLKNHIQMLPFKSPEIVREYMEKADIYVFGSDFREGWGAVVNESMNSACALVASHAAGSVPYLVKSGENGIIYKCGNVKSLSSHLQRLIFNKEERVSLGINAYKTVTSLWTAKTAVERFLNLCEKILSGEDCKGLYKEGPCSISKILKNNWIDKK